MVGAQDSNSLELYCDRVVLALWNFLVGISHEFRVGLKLHSSHEIQVKIQAQRGGYLNADQTFLPKNLAYLW